MVMVVLNLLYIYTQLLNAHATQGLLQHHPSIIIHLIQHIFALQPEDPEINQLHHVEPCCATNTQNFASPVRVSVAVQVHVIHQQCGSCVVQAEDPEDTRDLPKKKRFEHSVTHSCRSFAQATATN